METKTMKVHLIAVGEAAIQGRAGDTELLAARNRDLSEVSVPDFINDRTAGKLRIVVCSRHGTTTIAAMIMHALEHNNIPFEYLIGSTTDGYETMISPGSDTRTAVGQGDGYLTSLTDSKPEFHPYNPHIAVIEGITQDQKNAVSASEDNCEQFSVFASTIMPGGSLLYYVNDPQAAAIAENSRDDIRKVPFDIHGYMVNKTGCYAVTINRMVRVGFSGEDNMHDLSAAREVCLAAGLTEDQFYAAIGSGFSIPECNPSSKNLSI
jgi:UDP-N-acetylmuramate: L-alanyl-gamma-D-glutamyl-meso-diaminopimelate ligase